MITPVPLTTFALQALTATATEVHFVDAYPPPTASDIDAIQARQEGMPPGPDRPDGMGLWVARGARAWVDGNARLAGRAWLAVKTVLELKVRIAQHLPDEPVTDDRELLLAATLYNFAVLRSRDGGMAGWAATNQPVIDTLIRFGPPETRATLLL